MFRITLGRGLCEACQKRKDGANISRQKRQEDLRFLCIRHLTMFLRAIIEERKVEARVYKKALKNQ